MSTLTDHLSKIKAATNNKIREAAKTCYNTLKEIFLDKAKEALQDTLKKSEKERQQRAESRKRKKRNRIVAVAAAKCQSSQSSEQF